ncbi:hypothetical protein O181_010172 [Austropuccinia psidii MF-1]|uniref:Retrotransposon gag domain-containing protein n=1 Tax=Austropuccinia psidii MF-1 TaxID=1389203 RepID=A0A9Q3GKY9_9BASI|nr:hypothetical protein [Austropuccinia psidii MF-1]
MPIQHSPPAIQTRSQARAQAVLTPTPRAPLDSTPAVPQLRTHYGKSGTIQEGRKRAQKIRFFFGSSWHISRTFKDYFQRSCLIAFSARAPFSEPFQKEFPFLRSGRQHCDSEEKENSVEEEESDGTKGVPAPVGASQGPRGPTLVQSNHPEPSLLVIMQQMTQIMANLQAASSSDSSIPPALMTPSMKAPECFDGTQPFKPYLSNLTNQDPNYLLNSFRKAEAELDSSRIKEGWHISLYIADFRSLVSRIRDWSEIALTHHFRKGLPSRILDQLASHPSRINSFKDLIDVTLELDTRYHQRQKEKSHHQENKPEASKSNSPQPQNSSSSSQKKKKDFQKRDKLHSSLLIKDLKLINSEKGRRIKEGLCTYCGGEHTLESCFKRPQKKHTQPSGQFPSQEIALVKIILFPMVVTVLHPEHNFSDTPKGEDLILGFDFLNHFNPFIDWRKGLITFNADQKDSCDPSKSFSNAFSSFKSCVALVGDSRTPSCPSSVHIPSLNSHESLLFSRDEVFK